MKHVFVYGTLMYDAVWGRLTRRTYRKQRAMLPGYRRLVVRGELYPGAVSNRHSHIDGILYHDVQETDLARLDRFEGAYYRRVTVTVQTPDATPYRAEAYVFRKHYRRLLRNKTWQAASFGSRACRRFLSRYAGFVRQ